MKILFLQIQRICKYILGILLITMIFNACIFEPTATSNLERIKKFQYVSIDFNADIASNHEILSFSSLSVDNIQPYGASQNWPIEWSNNSFSVDFDYDYNLFSGERVHSYGSISGTLSEDGETIESLTANSTSDHPDEGDVYKYFISVINVPYDKDYIYDEYNPRFGNEGSSVSENIYSYSQSWDFTDSDGNPQSMYATTVNYNDPDDVPYLHITFSGN